MKQALVLEGGAMRGIYTAGVLDTFLENDIKFDAVVGVSAGALFGVNYLSKQRGRAIRYCKKYNGDKNYMGVRPFIKEGNIFDTEYAYYRVPHELDPFDNEEFKSSEVPFYAVVTNIRTGEAEYMQINDVFEQMDTLRASGSMPFASKPVKIGEEYYLDGAIADSIPFKKMIEMGYDKVVVVLTKCHGYVKKPIPALMSKVGYKKKYPVFEEKIRNRHIMYNNQMEELRKLKRQGIATVIRPSRKVNIKKTETDPDRMQEMYQLGINDCKRYLNSINKSDN